MNIEKRTEAIGELDNVNVVWENIQGPFIEGTTVHMPIVPEENISQKDINTFRGYIDHEVRHKRHTNGWEKLVPEFQKSPALKNIVNCLEDVRIELEDGKVGEQQNLRNLRKGFAIELEEKINEFEGFAAVLTTFMYRRLGIGINLNETHEEKYSEFQPYWDQFDTCENVIDIFDLSKRMVEGENNSSCDMPQQGLPQESDESGQGDEGTEGFLMPSDKVGENSDESQDGKSENSDEENADEKANGSSNEKSEDESESDEGDSKGSDSEESAEEKNDGEMSGDGSDLETEDSKSGDSDNSDDETGLGSEDEQNSDSGNSTSDEADKSGEENTVADEKHEKIEAADSEVDGKVDWDKISEEIESQDVEKLLEDSISETAKSDEDSSAVQQMIDGFTSYTKGDLHRYYEKINLKYDEWDIEKDSPMNVRQVSKSLIRALYSKTDTFKLNGFKKGKRIAKNRLAGFSQSLSDRPFYREINSVQLDSKISILVDLSGSMSHSHGGGKTVKKSWYKTSKIFEAISFAYTMGIALGKLKGIDFEIVGFYQINPTWEPKWRDNHKVESQKFTSGSPKVYEYFHEFGEKFRPNTFKNKCQQILREHICHSSPIKEYCFNSETTKKSDMPWFGRCNADSETVYQTAKKMNQDRKQGQNQFIFVISDGNPNAYLSNDNLGWGDGMKVSEGHLKKIVSHVREKMDINILGFGFSDASSIKELYGEKYSIYRQEFKDLSKDFVKELEKKLVGTLK